MGNWQSKTGTPFWLNNKHVTYWVWNNIKKEEYSKIIENDMEILGRILSRHFLITTFSGNQFHPAPSNEKLAISDKEIENAKKNSYDDDVRS